MRSLKRRVRDRPVTLVCRFFSSLGCIGLRRGSSSDGERPTIARPNGVRPLVPMTAPFLPLNHAHSWSDASFSAAAETLTPQKNIESRSVSERRGRQFAFRSAVGRRWCRISKTRDPLLPVCQLINSMSKSSSSEPVVGLPPCRSDVTARPARSRRRREKLLSSYRVCRPNDERLLACLHAGRSRSRGRADVVIVWRDCGRLSLRGFLAMMGSGRAAAAAAACVLRYRDPPRRSAAQLLTYHSAHRRRPPPQQQQQQPADVRRLVRCRSTFSDAACIANVAASSAVGFGAPLFRTFRNSIAFFFQLAFSRDSCRRSRHRADLTGKVAGARSLVRNRLIECASSSDTWLAVDPPDSFGWIPSWATGCGSWVPSIRWKTFDDVPFLNVYAPRLVISDAQRLVIGLGHWLRRACLRCAGVRCDLPGLRQHYTPLADPFALDAPRSKKLVGWLLNRVFCCDSNYRGLAELPATGTSSKHGWLLAEKSIGLRSLPYMRIIVDVYL